MTIGTEGTKLLLSLLRVIHFSCNVYQIPCVSRVSDSVYRNIWHSVDEAKFLNSGHQTSSGLSRLPYHSSLWDIGFGSHGHGIFAGDLSESSSTSAKIVFQYMNVNKHFLQFEIF